ncbi:hypothetical protein [Polycladidibacter hongkongensis]|nr:hypothetical protein [Pseudovibrio hongkongensis]
MNELDQSNRAAFEQFQMINEKTIETANFYLKSSLFINGGAAVSILGF